MTRPALIEQHLSPAQVGERLGLERHAVARLLRPGAIWPVARLNRKTIRIPASAVQRYLKSCTWEPRPVVASAK